VYKGRNLEKDRQEAKNSGVASVAVVRNSSSLSEGPPLDVSASYMYIKDLGPTDDQSRGNPKKPIVLWADPEKNKEDCLCSLRRKILVTIFRSSFV
jgi:hypothetical protein